MSHFPCDRCKSGFVTSFCACSYPLPRLCPACSNEHRPEPLHHLLPIAQLSLVQTKDRYQTLLTRLSKLDQAKSVLTNDVSLIEGWRAALQKAEETVKVKNRQYLESLLCLLRPVIDSALDNVTNNVANDDFSPVDDVQTAIWTFVLGNTGQFFSLIANTAETELTLMTDSFRVAINSRAPALQQYWVAAAKPELQPFSQEVGWKETFCNQADPGVVFASLFGCFICWCAIGYMQSSVISYLPGEPYDKSQECRNCCRPTLCCCIGAALNRTYIRARKGIRGSFGADVFAYCLHVGNLCLVFQEGGEVEGLRWRDEYKNRKGPLMVAGLAGK